MTVGNGFFRGHAIPETVTREQDEFTVGCEGHHFDIGTGSHSLVLCFHGRIVFVLEIAQSARQGKLAVDAAGLDKAVGVVDTFAFDGVIRFVVLTEGHRLLAAGENGARVARVGTVEFGGGDEEGGGGAASKTFVLLGASVAQDLIFAGW